MHDYFWLLNCSEHVLTNGIARYFISMLRHILNTFLTIYLDAYSVDDDDMDSHSIQCHGENNYIYSFLFFLLHRM